MTFRRAAINSATSTRVRVQAVFEKGVAELLANKSVVLSSLNSIICNSQQQMNDDQASEAELRSMLSQSLEKLRCPSFAGVTVADLADVYVLYGLEYDQPSLQALAGSVADVLAVCSDGLSVKNNLGLSHIGDCLRLHAVLQCAQSGQAFPPAVDIHCNKDSGDVRSWTVQQVGAWLQSSGFGEFAEPFAKHRIAGDVLCLVKPCLGIIAPAVPVVRRVALLKAIAELEAQLARAEAAEPQGYLLMPLSDTEST